MVQSCAIIIIKDILDKKRSLVLFLKFRLNAPHCTLAPASYCEPGLTKLCNMILHCGHYIMVNYTIFRAAIHNCYNYDTAIIVVYSCSVKRSFGPILSLYATRMASHNSSRSVLPTGAAVLKETMRLNAPHCTTTDFVVDIPATQGPATQRQLHKEGRGTV